MWDEGTFTSDAVGWVKVKASSLMLNNAVDDTFDLFFENKLAGNMHLVSEFAPEGGDAFEQMKEKYDE